MIIFPILYGQKSYYQNGRKSSKLIPSSPSLSPYYVCQNTLTNKRISFGSVVAKSKLINSGYKPCQLFNEKLSSDSNKIIIDSAKELLALSYSPELFDKKFVLTKDIDLSILKDFNPIGDQKHPFTGEFDGNGCKIFGLNIFNPNQNNLGLFGVCKSAKLKNIDIQDFNITGKSQVGTLVGLAERTEIDDCNVFNSKIKGLTKLGGLIGLSSNNILSNGFLNVNINASKNSCGSIAGYDVSSNINSFYSNSIISAIEEVGGFLGYANFTTINNCYCDGDIECEDKKGGIVGWGDSIQILNSYFRNSCKNIIGYDNDCDIANAQKISTADTMNMSFDNNLWQFARTSKYKSLPRLINTLKLMSPEDIFLQDLNFNIESGEFSLKPQEYKPFEKPMHFEINNKLIKLARTSKNKDELHDMFGNLVLKSYNNFEYKQYDEVLLEIINNPYFEPNRIYNASCFNDNFSCTPIFILTTLNRPYLLQETLKRNDLGNIEKINGWSATGKKTIMDRAIDHNVIDCVYVMLKAKNQHFDVEKYKKYPKSEEMQKLFNEYPNIPDYENIKNNKHTLEKINNIINVLTSVNIPIDFEDSQGNNLLNVAASFKDEALGLRILLNAIHRNFNIEHQNKNEETPLKIALNNDKYLVAYNLLKYGANIKTTNNNGENSVLVFSNIKNEDTANNFIDFAINKGVSINSQDSEGNTSLINAINSQKYYVIKNVLKQGGSINLPNKEGQTPLHYACNNQDLESMTLLLENFANVFALNKNGKTPKEYLTEQKLIKEYEKYEKLYNENNILSDNSNYLNISSNTKDENSFEEILKKITNTNLKEQENLTRILLNLINTSNKSYKDFTDIEGNNLLHIACMNKSFYGKELIKQILNTGFDINKQNNNGQTPLILAINTYLEADNCTEKLAVLGNIKFLLENNPDIELLDKNKQTALHSACKTDNSIILSLLLKNDPKINVKDILGNTPMNYIEADGVRKTINNYINKITN